MNDPGPVHIIIDIPLDDIIVSKTFRKDMGDIDALATDILGNTLLQPIGITPDKRLIFGKRRIAAYRALGNTTIPARVIEIENILLGQYSENAMRKDFAPSERDAIMRAIEREIGNRQGANNQYSKVLQSDRTEASVPVGTQTRDFAAQRAGMSSGFSARTRVLVDNGAPELIHAVDRKVIALDAGYYIATNIADHAEQRRILALPEAQRRAVVAKLRGPKRGRDVPLTSKKPSKPSKPTRPSQPARPPIERPTYWPTLSFDQQGFPPRETWEEPDPENPAMTRYQAHIAKHGHVHIMPLSVRQAQDRLIAARRLNSQIRELIKPVAAYLTGDPAPIDLAELVAALDEMPDADRQTVTRRLTVVLAELMPSLTKTYEYLQAISELVSARTSEPSAAAEVTLWPG